MADNLLTITVEKKGEYDSDMVTLSDDLVAELSKLKGIIVTRENDGKAGIAIPFLLKFLNATAVDSFGKSILGWLVRDRSRQLKFQIGDKMMEASNLTEKQQQELIQWFKTQAGMHLDK
jgi:hypothetical protein